MTCSRFVNLVNGDRAADGAVGVRVHGRAERRDALERADGLRARVNKLREERAAGIINDVRYAADLVERGLVDGVSMGRPLLADPDLPKKAYENRFDDITPCGSCGGRCITPEDPHHPVCKCHINPLVGHEYDYPFNPTDKPKKVLVIGAGPGG